MFCISLNCGGSEVMDSLWSPPIKCLAYSDVAMTPDQLGHFEKEAPLLVSGCAILEALDPIGESCGLKGQSLDIPMLCSVWHKSFCLTDQAVRVA